MGAVQHLTADAACRADQAAPPCVMVRLTGVFRSGRDLLVEPVEDAFAAYAGGGGLAV
jgi:hypothetical protein